MSIRMPLVETRASWRLTPISAMGMEVSPAITPRTASWAVTLLCTPEGDQELLLPPLVSIMPTRPMTPIMALPRAPPAAPKSSLKPSCNNWVNCFRPGFRDSVKMDLNMEFADFIRSWPPLIMASMMELKPWAMSWAKAAACSASGPAFHFLR